MKPSLLFLLVVLPSCLAPACSAGRTAGPATARHEYAEVHMAMRVRIVLHAADDSAARTAARAAFRRIAELEDVFSDYRDRSELRRLEDRAGDWVPVSEPLFDALSLALLVARELDGAFDPTVAPLTRLWREARRTGTPPDTADAHRALLRVGWQRVHLDSARRAVRLEPGTALDLGAVAKGWILDDAIATLHAHGVRSVMIEAGGDIRAGAPPPGRPGWAIDVPGAPQPFARRAAALAHAALATSGPAFQSAVIDGVARSHVLDPRSGTPLAPGATVHVLAPRAALADALATALGVLGPDGLAAVRRRWPEVHVSFVPGPH
jgi:FAD:protein FMN transferase